MGRASHALGARPRAGIALAAAALACAALAGAGCDRDLVPAPRAQHDARDDADARRLEVQLAALPGVARASVVVRRAFRDPLAAADAPAPGAAASVSILLAADAGLADTARRLARAAFRDVAPAAIAVEVVAPAPAPTTTATVGPFEVAAGSRGALRATLALALAAIAGLAGFIAYRERYFRRGIRPHQSSTSTTRGS